MSDAEPRRYDFIDSLRGWAILLVILTHAGQGRIALQALISPAPAVGPDLPRWLGMICANAGHGVQLFFVVSAFSLTLSWLGRPGGPGATGDFLIRRFFRIAPMFYLAILVYLAFYGLAPRLMAPHGIGAIDVLLTAGFLNVWRLNALNSVVPGDWSVGCETMFYLILPVILGTFRSVWGMAIVVLAFVVATQLRLHYLALHHFWGPLSAFEFGNQVGVFTFGILAAYLVRERWMARLATRIDGRVARCLLTGSIFARMVIGVPAVGLPSWWIESNMQFAALAGALCVSLYFFSNKVLVNRMTSAIGRRSFSMYLLHFMLLAPIYHLVQSLLGPGIGPAGATWFLLVYYTLLVGTTFAVASVSFKYIEVPGIALGRHLIALRHLVMEAS